MSLSDAVLGGLALTTFWDRKRVAMDVALGSTRELFSRLGHLRTYVNAPAKGLVAPQQDEIMTAFSRSRGWYEECKGKAIVNNGTCLPMRALIIGHSFGSLATYNAISASLIEEVTEGIDRDLAVKSQKNPITPSERCDRKVEPISSTYADLIILINPAFEGARFEPLYQASLNRTKTAGYSCRQNPVLAIITGTTDWATREAFPIGRWFSTRFTSVSPKRRDGESLEDLKQQEHMAERHAVGHIPRYMTHYLDLFPTNGSTDADTTKCLATDWRGIGRAYLSPGGLGVGELETAIRNIKTKWDERLKKNPKFWPARAFCGQLRLSFAVQETEEEADDPLDNLPDRSEESDPWAY